MRPPKFDPAQRGRRSAASAAPTIIAPESPKITASRLVPSLPAASTYDHTKRGRQADHVEDGLFDLDRQLVRWLCLCLEQQDIAKLHHVQRAHNGACPVVAARLMLRDDTRAAGGSYPDDAQRIVYTAHFAKNRRAVAAGPGSRRRSS